MSPDYPTGSLRLVHSTSVAVLRACASPSRRAGGPGKERERDREREEFGERVDKDSLSAEREFISSFTPLTPHCPPPRTPSATPAARVCARVPSKGSRGAKEGARVKTISLDSANDTRIQEGRMLAGCSELKMPCCTSSSAPVIVGPCRDSTPHAPWTPAPSRPGDPAARSP